MSYDAENAVINGKIGSVDWFLFNAGSFYSDGGSSFGILPKAVWNKDIETDNKNRIRLACNLLLLQAAHRNILVDTGMGAVHDAKTLKIYRPEKYSLAEKLAQKGLSRDDIDSVILTHLHHDHIGGLLTGTVEQPQLAFPNADYYVQKKEWETAVNPDELNEAAYRFNAPLKLLADNPRLRLIEGDFNVSEQIRLVHVGGHTVGSQSVRVADGGKLLYYAGDILPQRFHLSLSVTSAYDVSRQETVTSKKMILNELKNKKGILILNHETGNPVYDFGA